MGVYGPQGEFQALPFNLFDLEEVTSFSHRAVVGHRGLGVGESWGSLFPGGSVWTK